MFSLLSAIAAPLLDDKYGRGALIMALIVLSVTFFYVHKSDMDEINTNAGHIESLLSSIDGHLSENTASNQQVLDELTYLDHKFGKP